MDTSRIDEWRDSLRRQLDEQAARAGDLPVVKLQWLSEQMENYIERWLGFLAVTPRRRKVAGDDPLFTVIELAAEMMTAEIQKLPMATPVVQHWQDFVRVLNGIRTRREGREAEDVRTAF